MAAKEYSPPVVDNFSILLSHALLLLAFWRLWRRDDLDRDPPPAPPVSPAPVPPRRVRPKAGDRARRA